MGSPGVNLGPGSATPIGFGDGLMVGGTPFLNCSAANGHVVLPRFNGKAILEVLGLDVILGAAVVLVWALVMSHIAVYR
eukprot:gene3760-4164_t